MAKPLDISDDDFEEVVLKADKPVLVDFWAPWCAPCLAIAPITEELAGDYEGRASIVKVNVDQNPRTASRYSIHSIPTLILFKNGVPFTQIVGLMSKHELKENLDSALE